LDGDVIAEINNRIANRTDLSPSEAELLDVYLGALEMIHKKNKRLLRCGCIIFQFPCMMITPVVGKTIALGLGLGAVIISIIIDRIKDARFETEMAYQSTLLHSAGRH